MLERGIQSSAWGSRKRISNPPWRGRSSMASGMPEFRTETLFSWAGLKSVGSFSAFVSQRLLWLGGGGLVMPFGV